VRSIFASLLLAFTLTALRASPPRSPAADAVKDKDAPRLRLLIPAYFYPAGDGAKDWDRLFTASAHVPIVAIVNPASGPGMKADPLYLKLFTRAKRGEKITLIGYVHTSYGKRSLEEVKADVDRWTHLYPGVQGIFFDEQASGADHVAYQTALYKYVRAKRGLNLVITNPGTVCVEKYLSEPATDAACLFESPKLIDSAAFPKWVAKYSPGHVAALSYKIATAKAMGESIQEAVEKKIGYFYVTDAEGSNPWDRLPRYWAEEVELVRKVNQTK
jgi:Spherulation-specific family 4